VLQLRRQQGAVVKELEQTGEAARAVLLNMQTDMQLTPGGAPTCARSKGQKDGNSSSYQDVILGGAVPAGAAAVQPEDMQELQRKR
jgi:hypothetical protein